MNNYTKRKIKSITRDFLRTFNHRQVYSIINSFYSGKERKTLLKLKSFLKERNAEFLGIGQTRLVFGIKSKGVKYAVKIEHTKHPSGSNGYELENFEYIPSHLKCKLIDSFWMDDENYEARLTLVYEQLKTISIEKPFGYVFDVDDIFSLTSKSSLLKTFMASLPKPITKKDELYRLRRRIIDLTDVCIDVHIFNLGWSPDSILPRLIDFDNV